MAGNHAAFRYHVHPIDVAFDRHRLEGDRAWDAVRHVVEACELILVHLARLHYARIKGVPRQCRRRLSILLEHLADRLVGAVAIPLAFRQATFQQIRIQLVEVLRLGNRRRPATLKRFDPVLHVWLLITPGWHAKQRIEDVATRQGRVTLVQPAFTADQQFRGNRFGIVPPDFSRHATKILEATNHPFEDRFSTLGRQGHRKRVVRVRPDKNQDRNGTATLGKIDVDLAEIRFHPLARIMAERNERLTLALTTLGHVTSHRVVAALIFLGFQPLEDPHRRVALFRRRLLVGRENLVDEANELAQLGKMLILPPRIRRRLTIPLENGSNLSARVMKFPGDLADAHPIAIRPANPCVMIHRKHPILCKLANPPQGTSPQSTLR
ncbi:MAG: hypothetical protein QGD91_12205 [Actinomycetota bacterium]|nr:hypothetical protein [Actinomycetota bacterium]